MKFLIDAIILATLLQGISVQPGVVRGSVVQASNGAPVAAAGVELWRVGAASSSYIVSTNAKGEFLFEQVRPGEYHLAATHMGYVRSEHGQRGPNKRGKTITVGEGQQLRDLSIALTETGVIYGRVYNPDGMVQPNVQVQALRLMYQPSGRHVLETIKASVTNDLGEYRLFWLPPGRYYVSATSFPGSMPEAVVVPLGDGTAAMRSLSPAAGALVEVPGRAPGVPFYFPGTADARTAQAIDLKPGDSRGGVDVRVDARYAHRVKGIVTNLPPSNNPSERGFVQTQLVSRGTTPYPAILPSGAVNPLTGAFEIAGIPPGEYYLRVSVTFPAGSNRPFLFGRVPVDVRDQDVTDLSVRLERGRTIAVHVSIEGQRGDSPDLKRLSLSLYGQGQRSPQQPGLFMFSDVPPGDYRLNFIDLPAGGYLKSARYGATDVLADGVPVGTSDGPDSALPIEVVISTQGASLEGVVMNERREPVSDVVIAVVPEPSKRSRPELYRTSRSDNAGRFRVSGIAPGDYSVFVLDDVETGAWQDPEILQPFESQATKIHASDGSQRTLELTLPVRPR